MSAPPVPPPAELAELVDAIGAEGVLRLIEKVGGTRIYVPTMERSNVSLSRQIGVDLATQLSANRGGEQLDVPLARAWRIRVYAAQGMKLPEIARRMGMTKNGVARSLRGTTSPAARPSGPGPQPDLFEKLRGVRSDP